MDRYTRLELIWFGCLAIIVTSIIYMITKGVQAEKARKEMNCSALLSLAVTRKDTLLVNSIADCNVSVRH